MSLANLTFKLFNDAALTSAFSGTLQLTHNSDFSDNPQDFVLYLGSPNTLRKLQTNVNPNVDNILLTPTDLVTNWAASGVRTLGQLIEPTSANGFVYQCTTAGTSHASVQPTWPVTGIGSTVSDGTAVWTFLGVKHLVAEIILGLSAASLANNSPGAALSVATNINGGTAGAIPIHIRVVNAVPNIRNNAGHAEIGVNINVVRESAI